MSRHSPRRRHRASPRATPWLQVTLIVFFTLIGLGVLVGLCLLSPIGRGALVVLGALVALFALAVLSCVFGRLTAAVCNTFARAAGRHSLEKFVREQRPHSAA